MVQILCDYIIIDTIRCRSDVICNGIVSKQSTRLLYVFDICLISYNYHNWPELLKYADGTLFKHIHKPCVLFGHIAIATAVISMENAR